MHDGVSHVSSDFSIAWEEDTITLPPGNVSSDAAAIVSPGRGNRSHEKTRSTLADPTTTRGFDDAITTRRPRFDPLNCLTLQARTADLMLDPRVRKAGENIDECIAI